MNFTVIPTIIIMNSGSNHFMPVDNNLLGRWGILEVVIVCNALSCYAGFCTDFHVVTVASDNTIIPSLLSKGPI